jgi:heme/copper-type cytochrome/quinol oxidase subunit 2
MIRILRNRLALSTVITTLIILVVSILLASVLTYFAINVVSTRVQEESLSVSNQHIWVDQTTGNAVGAMTITNTGGRDVVLNKLAVRGQQCAWANVYSNKTAISSDITYVAIPDTSLTGNFTQALGKLVLPSGSAIGIIITSPDSIAINDIGITVGIAVHSAQAVYYSETNIQANP